MKSPLEQLPTAAVVQSTLSSTRCHQVVFDCVFVSIRWPCPGVCLLIPHLRNEWFCFTAFFRFSLSFFLFLSLIGDQPGCGRLRLRPIAGQHHGCRPKRGAQHPDASAAVTRRVWNGVITQPRHVSRFLVAEFVHVPAKLKAKGGMGQVVVE